MMDTLLGAIEAVFDELRRAEEKHHGFPDDPFVAVAVIGKELGELQQALLQFYFEPEKCTSRDDVIKEAVQTASMALRFLFHVERYTLTPTESQ